MVKIKKYPANVLILFLLLFLYAISDMQNSSVTYNAGSDRSSVYFFLIAIILFLGINDIFYLIKNNWKYTVTPVFICLLLIAVWITVLDIFRHVSLWTAFTHLGLCSMWLLGYMFFQFLFEYKQAYLDKISQCFFLIFALYVCAIFYYFYDVQIRKGLIPVLNLAYNVVVVVPWLFGLTSGKKRAVVMILSLAAIILSLKRGALIVLPLMFIAGLMIEAKRKKKVNSTLIKIILFLILFVIIAFAVNSQTDGFLFERFSADELESGSGRTEIYRMALDNIFKRDLFDLVVGLGSGASARIIGTGCHNEWLEFLFSFGIVGLLLYLILIIVLIKNVIHIRYKLPDYYGPSIMMLLYVLIIGMIGGIYFIHSSFFFFSFWGAMQGTIKARQRRFCHDR